MDIAAFMTWIRETIMKMGGMQTCDFVFEEMNPEGHFIHVLRCVHSMHKYGVCTARTVHSTYLLILSRSWR